MGILIHWIILVLSSVAFMFLLGYGLSLGPIRGCIPAGVILGTIYFLITSLIYMLPF